MAPPLRTLLRWLFIALPLALILGFCAFANLANVGSFADTEAKDRAAAEVLIEALEGWQSEHGQWPESLDVLDPPAPGLVNGDAFVYEPRASTGYRLSYPVPPLGVLPSDLRNIWDSRSRSWSVEAW